MTRMTKEILQAKVDYLNSIKLSKGFKYGLRYAYGDVRIVRCYNEGGESEVSPRGTKKDMANYLDVMISALLWDR